MRAASRRWSIRASASSSRPTPWCRARSRRLPTRPTSSSRSAATARCCMRHGWSPAGSVPLLGVNRGRLGFLTDVSPNSMLEDIDTVLAGRYTEDRRSLLAARLERRGRCPGARARPERRGVEQAGRPGERLDFETFDQRPLREFPQRRRHRDRHGDRIDRLRALLRRPDRRARSRRVGAGADLAAHPERPAHRGARRQHHPAAPIRPARSPRARSPATAPAIGDMERGDELFVEGADVPDHPACIRRATTYYRLLRSKLHWGRGAHDGTSDG